MKERGSFCAWANEILFGWVIFEWRPEAEITSSFKGMLFRGGLVTRDRASFCGVSHTINRTSLSRVDPRGYSQCELDMLGTGQKCW